MALVEENKIANVVGERTRGAGGMVQDEAIDIDGVFNGKKKIGSKLPFRYAYTNVLTPNFEIIEDIGVEPHVYYRSSLSQFRNGEEDGGWISKAIQTLK